MNKSFQSDDAFHSNMIESLRKELVEVVETKLTPVAIKYGYTEMPLEDKIKWRPMVLILGNYSSGKSTLINELLGAPIQVTGQAPTDDSFTVITYKDVEPPGESRDGMVLLNDPSFPFSHLKQYGQRFASHFRLKQLNAPLLKQVALIDTPGMLDSVAERDRGYDYQQVIAELASIADLILVLFDPHKAGTVRETYESLRRTLPRATYEDRIVFVLNRIDECSNLNDFLRVYGTLCWNLSQMTGRKDIPPIYLTYAQNRGNPSWQGSDDREKPAFLNLLTNQRTDLTHYIMTAPRYRLDNLVSFIETHASRMEQLLYVFAEYLKELRWFRMKFVALTAVLTLLFSIIVCFVLVVGQGLNLMFSAGIASFVWLLTFTLPMAVLYPARMKRFSLHATDQLERFVSLSKQQQKDLWEHVQPLAKASILSGQVELKARQLRADLKSLQSAIQKAAKEARQALSSVRL